MFSLDYCTSKNHSLIVLVTILRPFNWLERAKAFLKSALANFDAGNLEVAAFDVHQAIELSLKAVHIHKYGSRPYTHNLVELGKVVGFEDPNLEFISLMYTYARYPEAPLKLSKEKLRVMIDVAKRAIKFAEQELAKEP